MFKKITITNYLGESVEYKIEGVDVNNNNGLLITNIRGLGPVKANINMTDLATCDGGVFNSASQGSRNIVIEALFTTADTIEEARLLSYKFFPMKKPLTFRIETDNRIAETIGYVESNDPNPFSERSSVQISVLCESPYFLSPNKDITLFAGIDSLFQFPFENAHATNKLINFGEIVNKKANTVYYSGDGEVGCIIEIRAIGDVKNITMYNLRTRESMRIDTNKLASMTGAGLIAGDMITINTNNGSKSAVLLRNGARTNIINTLGKTIDWFKLSKGDNLFGFIAEDGEENIQFRIISQVAYEGV